MLGAAYSGSMQQHARAGVRGAMTPDDVAAFQRDGAVCLRGVFKDWVDVIAAGHRAQHARARALCLARACGQASPAASSTTTATGSASRNSGECVQQSPAAAIAAAAMRSTTAQFFHDHVLVKEPGTQKPTPWHQDIPYYFVDGSQTVSFWIPIDPVEEATLRLIAGSHRWDKWVLPVRWLDDEQLLPMRATIAPVPDPDREPGHRGARMADGSPATRSCSTSAPSTAPAATRPPPAAALCPCAGSATMPATPSARAGPRRPIPATAMQAGQRLREDWFPVLWPRPAT